VSQVDLKVVFYAPAMELTALRDTVGHMEVAVSMSDLLQLVDLLAANLEADEEVFGSFVLFGTLEDLHSVLDCGAVSSPSSLLFDLCVVSDLDLTILTALTVVKMHVKVCDLTSKEEVLLCIDEKV